MAAICMWVSIPHLVNLIMSIEVAIEILKEFNEWRNGKEIAMIPPKIITQAINTVIKHYEQSI